LAGRLAFREGGIVNRAYVLFVFFYTSTPPRSTLGGWPLTFKLLKIIRRICVSERLSERLELMGRAV